MADRRTARTGGGRQAARLRRLLPSFPDVVKVAYCATRLTTRTDTVVYALLNRASREDFLYQMAAVKDSRYYCH